MRVSDLAPRLNADLVDWFRVEIDEGDAPELHLVGLQQGDVTRCFGAFSEFEPRWTDRTFYIDDEDVDMTIHQRPELPQLLEEGRVTHACLGAERLTVDGVELPLVEMFWLVDAIEFFWWPGKAWSRRRVAAFFVLLQALLALVPTGALRPDPRYPGEARKAYGDLIAHLLGDPDRLDYGDAR